MADVNRGKRPLSPHLTIYRPQISSMSSIFIRITGVGLLVSFIMIVVWIGAAAVSEECFAKVNAFVTSWFGQLILIASLWGLWYHFLGGIRHLVFDLGYGFDLKTADMMGWVMIIGSFIMTALTLVVF